MGWRTSRRTRRAAAVVMAAAFAAGLSSCAVPRWQAQLASVNGASTGSPNAPSRNPILSPDGTKVLFESDGSDLGPNDTNGIPDLYLRDLTTGTTSLMTVNAAGTNAGNAGSALGVFSPDGTKVAFASKSTDLAFPTTGGTAYDAYVRDLVTGQTTLVSISADGTRGAESNAWPIRFSSDSNRLLFESAADNIAGPTPLSNGAVFERDLTTGQVVKLVDGNASSYSPSGDVVAYHRDQQVWMLDTASGARYSISDGLPGWVYWHRAVISHDGRNVAFAMLDNSDGVARTDIYVHDRVMHTTTLVTAAVGGGRTNGAVVNIQGFHPSDRNLLLFNSTGSNLAANDTNGAAEDAFIRDLRNRTTTLVSTNSSGNGSGNGGTPWARWVGDGSKVALVTLASNFGYTDTNGTFDVYMRDVANVHYSLVSVNALNDNSAAGASGQYLKPGGAAVWEATLSADGSRLAFGSNAGNLGPADPDRTADPNEAWQNHDIYVTSFVVPQ